MSSAPLATAQYPHIRLGEQGAPSIVGTTMTIVELVTAMRANRWNPDDLRGEYPFLAMSQIHSALAYYWDHQEALEPAIERQAGLVEEIRRCAEESKPVIRELDPAGLRQPQDPSTGISAIIGRWPGDESDDEIFAALDELS